MRLVLCYKVLTDRESWQTLCRYFIHTVMRASEAYHHRLVGTCI
jgi:hypothetical protein